MVEHGENIKYKTKQKSASFIVKCMKLMNTFLSEQMIECKWFRKLLIPVQLMPLGKNSLRSTNEIWMQSHLLLTNPHKTLIGKHHSIKDSFGIPVAVSFNAELGLHWAFPDRSKQPHRETANTSAVSSPLTTNQSKMFCRLLSTAYHLCGSSLCYLSVIFLNVGPQGDKHYVQWSSNHHQNTGACNDHPAWSFTWVLCPSGCATCMQG